MFFSRPPKWSWVPAPVCPNPEPEFLTVPWLPPRSTRSCPDRRCPSNHSPYPALWGAILCAATHTLLDTDSLSRWHPLPPGSGSSTFYKVLAFNINTSAKYHPPWPENVMLMPICPPSDDGDAPRGIRELHISSTCPLGLESARDFRLVAGNLRTQHMFPQNIPRWNKAWGSESQGLCKHAPQEPHTLLGREGPP